MSIRWNLCRTLCLVAALTSGLGCETLHNAGVPGLEMYLKPDPEQVAKEDSYREEFLLNRDHVSFYWLLAHKISNGMQLVEVENALGEPGEPTTEFMKIKSDGEYHTTDSAYRWGPDNKGFSAIVFFRDSRVVNFSRKLFETP